MSDYRNSYKYLLDNDWNCEFEFRGRPCRALLGRADPGLTILHQVRSTHHESWTYSAGGVVIAKRCRKCKNINWLASSEVPNSEFKHIQADFDERCD